MRVIIPSDFSNGEKMMKKLLVIGLLFLASACVTQEPPKETYPYGMSEKEWNELSIKDKARMRRDFYFYEKGSINFVDPQIDIEGKKEVIPYRRQQSAPKPAAVQ